MDRRAFALTLLIVISLACAARNPAGGIAGASFTPVIVSVSAGKQLRLQQVLAARVTPTFFRDANTTPLIGRFFVTEEYSEPNAQNVVILSHALWSQNLGADPGAIGSKLQVEGRDHVILGVARREFVPAGAGVLWLPARARPRR